MRATIRPLGVSSVILRYTDPYSGARRTREFTVIGKDVREYRADREYDVRWQWVARRRLVAAGWR